MEGLAFIQPLLFLPSIEAMTTWQSHLGRAHMTAAQPSTTVSFKYRLAMHRRNIFRSYTEEQVDFLQSYE